MVRVRSTCIAVPDVILSCFAAWPLQTLPAPAALLLIAHIHSLFFSVHRLLVPEQSSKRQTLKQKYTIQKLAKEHRRKQKKIAVKLGRPASTGSASL